MKTTFDLGLSLTPYMSKRRHVYIEMTYGGQSYRKPEDEYFSVTANIGGKVNPIVCGQCVYDAVKLIDPEHKSELLNEIIDLYNKYHTTLCRKIPEQDQKRILSLVEHQKVYKDENE